MTARKTKVLSALLLDQMLDNKVPAPNLHLSLIGLSQVSLRSLCAYFVIKTEPKILRLVQTRKVFVKLLGLKLKLSLKDKAALKAARCMKL